MINPKKKSQFLTHYRRLERLIFLKHQEKFKGQTGIYKYQGFFANERYIMAIYEKYNNEKFRNEIFNYKILWEEL